MKLSSDTVLILQNFMTINPSIVIRKGNVIKTMSTSKTVFGSAKVDDEFPCDFAIYDLSKFLSLISLTKDEPDIEFGEDSMVIKRGRSRTKYSYCAENVVASPPYDKDIKMPAAKAKFKLDQEVWQEVQKAMSIMGFEEFAFVGSEGKLSIQALSTMHDSSDTYECELGDTDLDFKAVLKINRAKFIPGNYDVVLTEKAAKFTGDIAEYVVALDAKNSEF